MYVLPRYSRTSALRGHTDAGCRPTQHCRRLEDSAKPLGRWREGTRSFRDRNRDPQGLRGHPREEHATPSRVAVYVRPTQRQLLSLLAMPHSSGLGRQTQNNIQAETERPAFASAQALPSMRPRGTRCLVSVRGHDWGSVALIPMAIHSGPWSRTACFFLPIL